MLRRWRAELIAFAVATGLGVGVALILGVGQTSERDKVYDAAEAYLKAFADDDPAALCQAISPSARVALEFAGRDCATSAQTAITKVPAQTRAQFATPKITVESVNESEARVAFSPALDGRSDMNLVKRGDAWFVNP